MTGICSNRQIDFLFCNFLWFGFCFVRYLHKPTVNFPLLMSSSTSKPPTVPTRISQGLGPMRKRGNSALPAKARMNPSRPGRKKVKFSPTEEESEESNGTSAQEKDVGETIVDVVDNPMHRGGEIGGKEDVPGSIYGDVGEGTGLEEVALDDDDSGNMGGRGGDEKWTETTIPVPTSLHSSLVILKTPSLHPIFIYFFHLITFLASLVGLYCFLEPSFPVKFYYFTMTWPFSFCSFMAVVMGAGSTIKADISHAKVLGISSLYR